MVGGAWPGWRRVDGEVEIGDRGGDDRREGGAAIKQRRPEAAATAAATGRLH